MLNLHTCFIREGCCYDKSLFFSNGISILEDLLINIADGMASIYLELISVDSNVSNEMNSLCLALCTLSTRALQRLRNEVHLCGVMELSNLIVYLCEQLIYFIMLLLCWCILMWSISFPHTEWLACSWYHENKLVLLRIFPECSCFLILCSIWRIVVVMVPLYTCFSEVYSVPL